MESNFKNPKHGFFAEQLQFDDLQELCAIVNSLRDFNVLLKGMYPDFMNDETDKTSNKCKEQDQLLVNGFERSVIGQRLVQN